MIAALTMTAALLFPVSAAPNWGAMYTPQEWNRPYEDMTRKDFTRLPKYEKRTLTAPMPYNAPNKYTRNEIRTRTAKLFYSTRYCGAYDLDAWEYSDMNDEEPHCSIDIKLPKGTPLRAVANGKITEATTEDDIYGTTFVQAFAYNGKRYTVRYAHLATMTVKKGDTVKAGATVGTVGMTGNTAAPHLHLEMKDAKGKHVNPMDFYPSLK